MAFGLNMISLPLHTSNVVQPFDVSCFKSFKIAFKKKKDVTMARSKYEEPNKITFVG